MGEAEKDSIADRNSTLLFAHRQFFHLANSNVPSVKIQVQVKAFKIRMLIRLQPVPRR